MCLELGLAQGAASEFEAAGKVLLHIYIYIYILHPKP